MRNLRMGDNPGLEDHTRRLPNETLSSVLSFLNWQSTRRAASVSSRWRALATIQDKYYARITLDADGERLSSLNEYATEIRRFLFRLEQALVSDLRLSINIHLTHGDGYDEPNLIGDNHRPPVAVDTPITEALHVLPRLLPRIIKLKIALPHWAWYPHSIDALMSEAPLLRSLGLEFTQPASDEWTEQPLAPAFLGSKAPRLSSLSLDVVSLARDNPIPAFSQVHSLWVTNYAELSDLADFAPSFPNLRTLECARIDPTNTDLSVIPHFPRLKSLDFELVLYDGNLPPEFGEFIRLHEDADISAIFIMGEDGVPSIKAIMEGILSPRSASFTISEEDRVSDWQGTVHLIDVKCGSTSRHRHMKIVEKDSRAVLPAFVNVVSVLEELDMPDYHLAELSAHIGTLPQLRRLRISLEDPPVHHEALDSSSWAMQCPKLDALVVYSPACVDDPTEWIAILFSHLSASSPVSLVIQGEHLAGAALNEETIPLVRGISREAFD